MASKSARYDLGIIGLGVMGSNLARNAVGHKYRVAGFDLGEEARKRFAQQVPQDRAFAADSVAGLVNGLKTPRTMILLVPAGDAVDSVIAGLKPHLRPHDIVIDLGNSHYTDTNRRADALAEHGIRFIGAGISGGAYGALHGASIMPGGPEVAYEEVRGMFEAVAAKVDDDPCVCWLGPGSAGHYVKMVHNGIEYGLMQLIAETYDLMRRGLGLDNEKLHQVYLEWNQRELEGYLMEITADIVARTDEGTGKPLVDVILDEAAQKGTGSWTSSEGLTLRVPIPTIDAAVTQRNLSMGKQLREAAERVFDTPLDGHGARGAQLVAHLERALYAATLLTYAQGFSLLDRASEHYGYGLHLADVARIWRGGCIIRAACLEKIRQALQGKAGVENLILDPEISREIEARAGDLRKAVAAAVSIGVPAPGLSASLAYFDSCRSDRLPANLIQAQRDYFGSHTYQRVDTPGVFHTEWSGS